MRGKFGLIVWQDLDEHPPPTPQWWDELEPAEDVLQRQCADLRVRRVELSYWSRDGQIIHFQRMRRGADGIWCRCG